MRLSVSKRMPMSEPRQDPSRRNVLTFIGATPAAFAMGGFAGGCADRPGAHRVNEPHIAGLDPDGHWRLLEAASNIARLGKPRTLPEFDALEGHQLVLTGFLRQTATFNRMLLTQRAAGCAVCARRRLWPAVEVRPAYGTLPHTLEAISICGIVELRRRGDRQPIALHRAFVLEA